MYLFWPYLSDNLQLLSTYELDELKEVQMLSAPEHLRKYTEDGKRAILDRIDRFLPIVEEENPDEGVIVLHTAITMELERREAKDRAKLNIGPEVKTVMIIAVASLLVVSFWRSKVL